MQQACTCLLIALLCAGNSPAQDVPLRIVGLDGKSHELAPAQWETLPRVSVKAVDHGGAEATFEGVPAAELLKLAAAPLGAALRGENVALYVVAEGADGYKAVYALTEFDPAFTDRVIVVADRRSGQTLSSKEGPLRVVVPWEKRQARWVRQLVKLRIERTN
jgi:hypothetical protein